MNTAPTCNAYIDEYSPEERKQLLRLAHHAIAKALSNMAIHTAAPSAHLDQPRGAFTSLHSQGRLRGCIGYVAASSPLYRTVAETAIAAAFHDSRFAPVTVHELPLLQIEISVLSPMFHIAPEAVEVGRHGLLVTLGSNRGLLLPQVPLEWGWDREKFLCEVCRKAGLTSDAWRQGAKLEAFTAEVFGETEPGESLRE